MYANDTVLRLKTLREPDAETGEEFAYNRVRVIGESPISHAHKGDWTGQDAAGVILTPLSNFGGTIDYPFGFLRETYDVESIPEVVVEQRTQVRVVDSSSASAGQTPEEIFRVEAPGSEPEEGQTRARTAHADPLGPPGGPKDFGGPLGPSTSQRTLG